MKFVDGMSADRAQDSYLSVTLGVLELLALKLLELERQQQGDEKPDPRATDPEMANVAVALCDVCGVEAGDGNRVCETEGYQVWQRGDRYQVRDQRGQVLMQFKVELNAAGERIPLDIDSQWSDRQRLEWLSAGRATTRDELRAMQRNPQRQAQALGNLAQAGTQNQIRNQQAISVAQTASRVLASVGARTPEGKHWNGNRYRLQERGREIRVDAKDGRGTILRCDLEQGEVKMTKLSPGDYQQFREIERLFHESVQASHRHQEERRNGWER